MLNLIKTLVKTAPGVHPDSESDYWFCRLKYCLRGLAQFNLTREWFKVLEQPELAVVARNHPYIFCRLQRPYLNRDLNARQRLEVLKHHYRFVLAQFSKSQIESIFTPPGLLLATVPLDEIGNFGLRLIYSRHEKEGDLLINLVNLDTSALLFELSFSVSRFAAGQSEIFIGGLQGNKSTNDRDLIVAITRAMYGLRPKAFLFFVLQQLAACWGVASLRAVGDDTHIYRHPKKRKELAASYDAFWTECGGRPGTDGMFDLPAVFVPRPISSLKVNKRQMYRRRYTLLAQIAEQVSRQMLRPGTQSGKPEHVFSQKHLELIQTAA